jgi:ATP-dependent Clp protease ATP-binding subunit ClpC
MFRPEFLNRVDEIIVFHALLETHITKIVDLMIDELQKRLKEQEITIALTRQAKEFLAKEGYDPQYGARPLKRAIQRHIEDRLSEALLSGTVQRGDHVEMDADGNQLKVRLAPAPTPQLS